MKATSMIESLHPGNFALVMATGIISIALGAIDQATLSSFFAIFAVISWFILIALCMLRAALFHKAILIDLTSPRMVFSSRCFATEFSSYLLSLTSCLPCFGLSWVRRLLAPMQETVC